MSNINPLKILSDLENEKSEVKNLSIADAILATIFYLLILYFFLGIAFGSISLSDNIVLQLLLSIFTLAFTFFAVTEAFYRYYITNFSSNKIEVRPVKKFTLINALLLILIVLGYLIFFDSLLMPIDKILPGFNSVTESIHLINKNTIFFIGMLSYTHSLCQHYFSPYSKPGT
ncbi:hypothetical protein [Clostridium thailandense]|uniref:hypothetical protein n=1 Tax=Clostridium thailandense TaxID=2794346 RepID=UPI00398A3566